jgi:hypothetical protein
MCIFGLGDVLVVFLGMAGASGQLEMKNTGRGGR